MRTETGGETHTDLLTTCYEDRDGWRDTNTDLLTDLL